MRVGAGFLLGYLFVMRRLFNFLFILMVFISGSLWTNDGMAQSSVITTTKIRPTIDKVLVEKSKRKLYLMSGRNVIKTYNISLGKKPFGPKVMEGDKRTPEGLYWIDWRKQSDKFNLAMHISYPNSRDVVQAKKQGVSPGSMIMIHGTPIDQEYPEWYFRGLNWTDGCIAMMNWDMKEVWSLVKDGTLIEIRP